MIHVHHIPGLTVADRKSHVQEFASGMRVGDVVPADYGGSLLLNSVPCGRDDELRDLDHVHMVDVPRDPATVALNLILTLAISEAIKLLLPTPDAPKERGDERSPTHGYSRMKNIRVEGQPIPRGHGIHRVPGTIINEFVEVDNATGESTYYALVCIGHGPVEAIAGATVDTPGLEPLTSVADTVTAKAFINDNPISNFSGVEMWVRLGTNQQTVIPGFERTKTTEEVNVFLDSPDVGVGSANDLITDYNSDADDDHWEEFGFAYDTTAEVDGVEVVMNFPTGLYRVDGSGNILASRWVVGIRFCKLDGSGNPVLGPGNGGNQNDGWVRLPFEEFNLSKQSSFQLSFPTWLYDPSDHIDRVPGEALFTGVWFSGSEGWRTIDFVDSTKRPNDWPSASGTCDEFSFECWVAFDIRTGQGPFDFSGNDAYVCLMEWSSDGDSNGVWCGFRVTENGEWYPHFHVGKWGRFHEWTPAPVDGSTLAVDKKWHHYVFTHKRYSSSHNVTKFWMDGVDFGAREGNTDIITPSASEVQDARFTFGYSNDILTSTYAVKGWWDEVVVHANRLSTSQVLARYNSGLGQLANGSNPDVVALYHFDGSTFIDSSSYRNNAEQIGGNTVFSVGGGIVTVFEVPARTRGKYRVQVVRVNGRDTQANSRRQDDAEWNLAVTWIDEAFTYPGAAYYGVRVPATEQLNTSAPDLTSVAKMGKVLIWDGVSTIAPSFTRKWTRNTAWIVVDAATDPIFGGGSAFKIENVDLPSTQAFADYCDTRVYDGRGRIEFYRQEFEPNANKIASPEIFSSAFWNTGTATVTSNTSTAPNGDIAADRITDGSGPAARFVGTSSIVVTSEPTDYALQLSVKKDATATSASASIETIVGGITTACSFNLDDGTAIRNCVVIEHPLDSDWWLVKMDPVFSHGGGSPGTFLVSIYPARYDYGTSTENTLLEGSMDVWGCFVHRGKVHLDYALYSDSPRAFIYIGNRDDDDAAQTIPEHWVVGSEVRLRNCGTSDWDTPNGATDALTIQELEEIDNVDGYKRVWKLTCLWYSDHVSNRPSGSFPALLRGSRDWEDPYDDWVIPSTSPSVAEFDDGGTTGGPVTTAPLADTVLAITTDALNDIQQTVTLASPHAAPGETIRARGLFCLPTAGSNLGLRIVDGSTATANITAKDVWETIEVTLISNTSTPDVEVFWLNVGGGIKNYVDGLGLWVVRDLDLNVPGGSIEGAEALHTYDAQHDTFKGFWRTIVDMCLTARCIPVREGDRLRFKPDLSRSPVGLVTFASTVVSDEGSSSFRVRYTNRAVRSNSYTIDFHDERLNWERSTAMKESADLEGSADAGLVRSEGFFIQGMTRRSAVLRHGAYLIAQNESLVHEGSFQCSPAAVFFEPGDVIEVAHDIMPWGQSGRCQRASSRGINLIPSETQDIGSWTHSASGSLTIKSDVRPLPNGDPKGDLVISLSSSQTQLQKTLNGLQDGVTYILSFYARAKVAPGLTSILINQAGSGTQTLIADFAWASHTISETTSTGNTIGATPEGDGWWRIFAEYVVNGGGAVTFSIIPARGTGILGAEVYLGDAQVERASTEPTSFDKPGVGIFLDRKVILEPGDSYTARVTNSGTGESATCDVIATSGEYLVGDVIRIDTVGLGFNPGEGDEYILYTDAERFQIQVIELGINQTGAVDVEWIEYDNSVYDGDDLDENIVVESFESNNGGRQSGESRDTLLPGEPASVSAEEFTVQTPGGATEPRLEVSWVPDPDTRQSVREYHVYVGYRDSETQSMGELRHAAQVPGGTTSAVVRLPDATPGAFLRVAVQPVSWKGFSVRPERCGGTAVVLEGRAPQPDPPTNFVAHMEGEHITYSWDAPASNPDGLVYEIRLGTVNGENAQGDLMGGWALAQKIGETSETNFGPTSRWATCNTISTPANVEYMLRARNAHGVYSDVVVIQYGARVLNADVLTSANWWLTYVTQAWHDYADGWKTDAAAPTHDPNLTNLQRHADGYLEFSGSALTGRYRTASIPSGDLPQSFELEQRLRIEAIVYAIARDPTPVGIGDLNADGTTRRDFTPLREQEGWLFGGNVCAEGHLQGDIPTLKLQMKLIRDGATGAEVSVDSSSAGTTGWIDYKPGTYYCHGAQFRIVATRPTADWDVRIHEFYVQVQRALDNPNNNT